MCLDVYSPVCGYDGTSYVTFSNSCDMSRGSCLRGTSEFYEPFIILHLKQITIKKIKSFELSIGIQFPKNKDKHFPLMEKNMGQWKYRN